MASTSASSFSGLPPSSVAAIRFLIAPYSSMSPTVAEAAAPAVAATADSCVITSLGVLSSPMLLIGPEHVRALLATRRLITLRRGESSGEWPRAPDAIPLSPIPSI